MGKNNRCKGKKRKPQGAQQFTITPKEIAKAETEFNRAVQGYISDANWIFSIINEYVLIDTFRFSKKMTQRYIEERKRLVKNAPPDHEKLKTEYMVKLYRRIEEVVGTEAMKEWFEECPDLKENKVVGGE